VAVARSATLRCFVAIDLSPEVRAAVARAQLRIRKAAPGADVRWSDPEQFHLTLKFLGAVPEERVPAVSSALEPVAATAAPIALGAAALGAFPSLRRPRVLWAGLTAGVAELAALAASVDGAVAALGFPREARPFSAHLTIGRVRSPRGGGALAAAVEGAGAAAFGSWTASELVLYESRLRPAGALHVPVTRHRLRGGRA
jgi:2'-5' RNA ligase